MSPPEKLPVPLVVDLYANPREEPEKRGPGWVLHPMMRLVQAFEQSVREHPLIPMGTPDPPETPSG